MTTTAKCDECATELQDALDTTTIDTIYERLSESSKIALQVLYNIVKDETATKHTRAFAAKVLVEQTFELQKMHLMESRISRLEKRVGSGA